MQPWGQIQYYSITEPVPVAPGEQDNPHWFPQWQQPTDQPVLPVEYRFLFDSWYFRTEPTDVDYSGALFPPLVQIDTPVLPEDERYLFTDYTYINVPELQINPVWFPMWMMEIDQPVWPVEYGYFLREAFSLGEPIEPPAPAPEFSWFRQPDEPVLPETTDHLLGVEAFVNDESFHVPSVWFPQWMGEISQPVLPIEYRQWMESFHSLGVPIPPVPDYGWYREVEQPVLPIEYRHDVPDYFDPANWQKAIATDSGVDFPAWLQPIEQPVLPVEYRYHLPSHFMWVVEDDFRAINPYPMKVSAMSESAAMTLTLTESGAMTLTLEEIS